MDMAADLVPDSSSQICNTVKGLPWLACVRKASGDAHARWRKVRKACERMNDEDLFKMPDVRHFCVHELTICPPGPTMVTERFGIHPAPTLAARLGLCHIFKIDLKNFDNK